MLIYLGARASRSHFYGDLQIFRQDTRARRKENHLKYSILIIFAIILIAGLLSPLLGGPGASDDPVVSLSYLELATRYGEIPLRKGEELPIPSGASFVLFSGDAELRGVGDYIMIDLTVGKSYKRGKGISENHLYVVTGGNDIKIAAKGDCKILIRGGDTGPLRKAQ